MDSAPTTDTAGSTGSTGSAGALQGLPYPDRPVSGPDTGLPSPVAPTSTSPTTSAPAPATPPAGEDVAAPEAPDAPGASAGTTGSAATPHDPEGGASRSGDRSDAHVVRSGDTLWAIARARLAAADSPTSDAEVSRAVTALHLANHEVVGGDPDVILPGQRLALDLPDPTHREDAR
ncbi:LysM peptidoglycan-binding domain-containing protein [Nocardioides jishulii]|uniref:LysM peptidoglycan-binding domain-containing protein n=2 Tax=Nocardioides jishulii TaxID=2575440 RepID=A0A4U2YJT9_9ACTN|nr:LysM peptidoglycan-binding domain-containing protein [Nocardioides jishulii]TKI60964.1 LysM peptidoglycan-binding domain-containing protein [Nocardioides jishulii]